MAEVRILARVITQTIPTIKFNGVEDIQAISNFIERYGGRFESVNTRPEDEEQAKKNGWYEDEVAWWHISDPHNHGYLYQLILKPGDVVSYKNFRFEITFLDNLEADGFKEVKVETMEELLKDDAHVIEVARSEVDCQC